ncbi:hypothetical protein [Plasticicumulans sp.]|uniref:hypothetical protein n=1 Tax=Plasticicumulans sp. TaxID=2307179 RepID=UPI003950B40A
MYNILELTARLPAPPAASAARQRLFFSIYYRVADHAFKRAAATWKAAIGKQFAFDPINDIYLEQEVVTETQFKAAWDTIAVYALDHNCEVWAGHLLTHASKDTNDDGLEFKKDDGDDGTLKRHEIMALPILPWSKYGALILGGCNTGLSGKRGWTPAQVFAQQQRIITLGQTGYAYFSNAWNDYSESSPSDTSICLWAYARGKNGKLGNGNRLPGSIFLP